MPKSTTYLVPLDFSRGSERALDYALKLARQRKGKVVALHVIPAEVIYTPLAGRFDFYALLERDARESFRKFMKRKRLKPEDCRLEIVAQCKFRRSNRAVRQEIGRHHDRHG